MVVQAAYPPFRVRAIAISNLRGYNQHIAQAVFILPPQAIMWAVPLILVCQFIYFVLTSPIIPNQNITVPASLYGDHTTTPRSGVSVKDLKIPAVRPSTPYRWQSDSDIPLYINFLKFGKAISPHEGESFMYANRYLLYIVILRLNLMIGAT